MKPKGKRAVTYIQLLILHVALALVIYFFRGASKFILLGIVVYFLIRVFNNGNKKDEVLLAAGYITGFEVFSRMTGGALTYEFAKYAVIMFLVIGMFFKGFHRKSWAYVVYLFFLTPGILFSAMNLSYDTNIANAIGFNLSGPVCLGISALYCYDRKMPYQRLQEILLAVLLPLISMTIYLYIYTPSIKDVVTGTQSNFAASGGFGPNQVSTILGLGSLILLIRLFTVKNRFLNLVDLGLLALLSYRAIVTFSRGGVVTAMACAMIFLAILFLRSSATNKAKMLSKVAVITGVVIVTWIFTSFSTSGLIDKRYANQDAAGREKQDLTTGRAELLNEELEAFYQYPLTGVGIGKAKEFRLERTGRLSASHNELSRILSEHGLFGLASLFVLIITPLVFRLKNRSNIYLLSFVAFWFFTINHSSMRIAAPAFIYGLALITVINGTKKKPNTLSGKPVTS